MKTDPISAAAGYRMALERIARASGPQEMRKLAASALEITYDRPEPGTLSISSGWGHRTQQPYVTIALANPQETANPAVQIPAAQARQIAQQILEAAEASESDGFLIAYLTDRMEVPLEKLGAVLGDFREWRAQRRRKGSA